MAIIYSVFNNIKKPSIPLKQRSGKKMTKYSIAIVEIISTNRDEKNVHCKNCARGHTNVCENNVLEIRNATKDARWLVVPRNWKRNARWSALSCQLSSSRLFDSEKFHICDCLLCAQLRCAIQWAFCRKKTTTTTRSRRNNGNSVCLDRMLLWSFWLRRYRQQRVQLGCVLWLLWTFGMYNLVCWVDEMCAQWFASQIFIHTAQHKYTRTQQPDQRIETERNIVIIIYLLMAIHFKPSEEKKKNFYFQFACCIHFSGDRMRACARFVVCSITLCVPECVCERVRFFVGWYFICVPWLFLFGHHHHAQMLAIFFLCSMVFSSRHIQLQNLHSFGSEECINSNSI